MSEKIVADIRERYKNAVKENGDCWMVANDKGGISVHSNIVSLIEAGIPDLLDENARLNSIVSKFEVQEVAYHDTINKLTAIVKDGYMLSTWAAGINWDGRKNQKEWLDGLKERIEKYQSEYEEARGPAQAPRRGRASHD